jgi:hypothetical protein
MALDPEKRLRMEKFLKNKKTFQKMKDFMHPHARYADMVYDRIVNKMEFPAI